MKVTAIFDIARTNKQCLLFDKDLQIVFKKEKRFKHIKDEDGDPCENRTAITAWIFKTFFTLLHSKKYNIQHLNFCTYGASWVHIDRTGKPVTPIYDHLKPYPESVLNTFYQKYGTQSDISLATASPPFRMSNAGLQLYWLKYCKPQAFARIHWALHLPQYLSYLFTGIPISEFTSLGCHTALWDYDKEDYHSWVYAEHFDRILPHLVTADGRITKKISGKEIEVGIGIHNDSAALHAYEYISKEPFILISTGSCNISINPFNQERLSLMELNGDCLQILKANGSPAKAARLSLENEYHRQVQKLAKKFKKRGNFHRHIPFNEKIFRKILKRSQNQFHFKTTYIHRKQPNRTDFGLFNNFKTAYHQLMLELIKLQVKSTNLVWGSSPITKIYVDGIFASNDLFMNMLSHFYPHQEISASKISSGSALGAALITLK